MLKFSLKNLSIATSSDDQLHTNNQNETKRETYEQVGRLKELKVSVSSTDR